MQLYAWRGTQFMTVQLTGTKSSAESAESLEWTFPIIFYQQGNLDPVRLSSIVVACLCSCCAFSLPVLALLSRGH
jgi:hypothetical protein